MNLKFSLPSFNPNLPQLRINGFGACMIAGTPHRLEDSFFWKACTLLQANSGQGIEAEIVSLGGFPTKKAAPHASRALKHRSDLIIIQLGSTDLTVDLKAHILNSIGIRRTKASASVPSKEKPRSTSEMDGIPQPFRLKPIRRIVNSLKLLACHALKVKPIHGDDSVYLPAIAAILDTALANGSLPVLLAPFPHGDPVSNLWAHKYSLLLKKLADDKGVIFVDTFKGLQGIPFEDLLLKDKLHLSLAGHAKVGEMIAEVLERCQIRRLMVA